MQPLVSFVLGIVALLVFCAARRYNALKRQKIHGRLPPGPKPLPFVGNVFDLPPPGVPEFQHWLKHKDKYGPVSSIHLMGLSMVIFHDKETAYAVMAKKAQKSAARPQLNFASLAGFEDFLITHQYNDKYRLHRKMVHQQIGTKGLSSAFQPLQEKEALKFILQTYNSPENMMIYLKRLAAAIVLKIMYGYEIERNGPDPLVKVIEHAMDNLSLAYVPLSWLVDCVPAIKYLPDWFPGTGYRKTAREFRAINDAAAEIPFAFVKRQMAMGTNRPSYVSNLLESTMAKNDDNTTLDPRDEEAIKMTAVSMFAAGSDSTVVVLESVILAFLIFPEVVSRAQEEIDRVVGSDRLPGFEDRKNLPYIEGIVKEAWRWNPVGPMGLAHKSEEDIIYGEYLIPKGSYLLPSLWWFLHDPKEYSDPETFKPERYMEPLNETDPSEIAFGYGRRSCAGRFFADASVYTVIAQLLAVFDIRKARDADGNEIPVKLESVAGMLNRPKPFAWKIEPRSLQHAEFLSRMQAEQDPVTGDSALLNIFTV